MLPPWQLRPSEEAHNFNPAFCGALTFEFVKSFTKAKGASADFPLTFCALAIGLYPETRLKLPSTTRTSLYSWIERTPEALVGYSNRAKSLVPYVKEAISYAAQRDALAFTDQGELTIGKKKATFTEASLAGVTTDLRDTVKSMRMIGKWFAAAGETQTILASLGVRV